MERNLYFAAGSPEITKDLTNVRAQGAGKTDVYADPLFAVVAPREFRLKPDSPALKLGIKQLSVKGAGLRPDFPEAPAQVRTAMTSAISRRSALKGLLGAVPAAAAAQGAGRPMWCSSLPTTWGGEIWAATAIPGSKRPPWTNSPAQGSLFTQHYSNNPVCSPSRTAWMTGQFPAHHRIHAHISTAELNAKRAMPNFLDPAVVMLPRVLKDAGYATSHCGKWHLGRGPGAPLPDAYGFTHYRTTVSNDEYFTAAMKDKWFWSKSTSMIVDETIKFIEQNRNRPFYANVWTLLPHAPLNPTEEQMAPYERFAAGPRVDHRTAREIYFASVTDLDTQIGRLLNKLDELGLSGNTLVVFSSDNGPEDIHINNAGHSGVGSPGPFRGRKRSLYEGGVRLPHIARLPGRIPAGPRRFGLGGHGGGLPALGLRARRPQTSGRLAPGRRGHRRHLERQAPAAAQADLLGVEIQHPGLSRQPESHSGNPGRQLEAAHESRPEPGGAL